MSYYARSKIELAFREHPRHGNSGYKRVRIRAGTYWPIGRIGRIVNHPGASQAWTPKRKE